VEKKRASKEKMPKAVVRTKEPKVLAQNSFLKVVGLQLQLSGDTLKSDDITEMELL
jgi:hypothetical protein